MINYILKLLFIAVFHLIYSQINLTEHKTIEVN